MPNLPSLEYLFGCPDSALQQLELSALASFSNHLKATKSELMEAAIEHGNAGIARWFRENRERIIEAARESAGVDSKTLLARFAIPEPEPEKYTGEHRKPRWS
jgi:hypothetical protein